MTKSVFDSYLEMLLSGDHRGCSLIIQRLLEEDVPILDIYALFEKALYRVGELWEQSKISVATEHLATSITGSLLTLLYPKLFASPRSGRRAVVACVGSEYHELGAKMVADTFELHGWDAYFLGANTPVEGLLAMVAEKQPEVVGLSVSLRRNLDLFKVMVNRMRELHPQLEIIAGGQALRLIMSPFEGDAHFRCLDSLDDLKTWITAR